MGAQLVVAVLKWVTGVAGNQTIGLMAEIILNEAA
jgi:hypothetical protein